MAVGDFAKAFREAAQDRGIELTPEVTLPWSSGIGHTDPAVATAPAAVLERLAMVHTALGGDADRLRMKRRVAARMDFTAADNNIVELDEFQHFTTYRLATLDHYGDLEHGLDVDLYRRLCTPHAGRADAYRAAKPTADFPQHGGRAAQRAYLDMCRDLLGPVMGYRVIRIPSPTHHVDAAVRALVAALS